ncbi:MAG TPA: glycosyltransferase family 2 protein [Verrucomicrobiae bacterium]|nr:glycosyltransferase family 2 protein [Verrucomicrobiae bacterium]
MSDATRPADEPVKQQTVTLSILLPVRNEGINLRIMVKLLKAVVEVPHEILIVYDFPEDDSIPVIRGMQNDYANLHLVHNEKGRGVVNAIRAGVDAAVGDYVLIFAADEVGPLLAIEDMVVLMQEGCDMVSCSRYAHGGRRLGGSLVGGALSRIANRLFHRIAGCVLSDATTGIKLFRRSMFSTLDLEARPVGWAVTFEIAMKAQFAGWKLGEVPVISIDRLYGGESTFRLGPWTGEYLRWFLWGCKHLRRVPPSERPVVRVRAASAFPSTGEDE